MHTSKQFPNDMAYCLSTSIVKPNFLVTFGKSRVLDSGASDHMTTDMFVFDIFSHSTVKKGVITSRIYFLPLELAKSNLEILALYTVFFLFKN